MVNVKIGDVVLPGDRLLDIDTKDTKHKIILGPGLRRDDEKVYACKAGILRKKAYVYYVDSYQKR